MKYFRVVALLLPFVVLESSAQVTAAGASAAPTQGSTSISSQIIAYRVIGNLAKRLAVAIKDSKKILLSDPNSTFEMSSYTSFEEILNNLSSGYDTLAGKPAAKAFADTTSAVASLITAIKSSAVYTNANFQPTPQSFLALLDQELKNQTVELRTSASPGNQNSAALDLQADLAKVFAAQAAAQTYAKGHVQNDEEKANMAELDKQLLAVQASLSTTTPDGTLWTSLIKGRALIKALTANYAVLTVSIDAAGGDSKVTHWGLYEILFPTQAPSYNGGAVVSYTLSQPTGQLISSDMFVGMYDFEKLKSPKLPDNQRNADPTNSIPVAPTN